jgi:hypothetical protein
MDEPTGRQVVPARLTHWSKDGYRDRYTEQIA